MPRHHGVDEVGVTGVVVLGVPVEALAEAAHVGGEHHVAALGQLVRVVGVGRPGALEPDRLGPSRARARGRPAPPAPAATSVASVAARADRPAPTSSPRCRRPPCRAGSRRTRPTPASRAATAPWTASAPAVCRAVAGTAPATATGAPGRRGRVPAVAGVASPVPGAGSGSTWSVWPRRTIHQYQGE